MGSRTASTCWTRKGQELALAYFATTPRTSYDKVEVTGDFTDDRADLELALTSFRRAEVDSDGAEGSGRGLLRRVPEDVAAPWDLEAVETAIADQRF